MSVFATAKENKNLRTKYLSPKDIQTIDELKQAIKDDDTVVTCMGLYNHGKSSLLNSLVKDTKNKIFKTADTRETEKNKIKKYNNYTFVDTPGLNAKKHDDKRVMDAIKISDINIFVHNINTGELVAKEVEFFHNIKSNWENPKTFIDRTIFVLSRIDEINDDDDIQNNINRINQQIKEIFDINAIIIPVSAKDWVDGTIAKDKELIDISNISILENRLSKLHDEIIEPIKQTKKDRLDRYLDSLIEMLGGKVEEQKLELNKLQSEQNKMQKSFEKDIKRIEETISQKKRTI